jgi:hypothetical protein
MRCLGLGNCLFKRVKAKSKHARQVMTGTGLGSSERIPRCPKAQCGKVLLAHEEMGKCQQALPDVMAVSKNSANANGKCDALIQIKM